MPESNPATVQIAKALLAAMLDRLDTYADILDDNSTTPAAEAESEFIDTLVADGYDALNGASPGKSEYPHTWDE